MSKCTFLVSGQIIVCAPPPGRTCQNSTYETNRLFERHVIIATIKSPGGARGKSWPRMWGVRAVVPRNWSAFSCVLPARISCNYAPFDRGNICLANYLRYINKTEAVWFWLCGSQSSKSRAADPATTWGRPAALVFQEAQLAMCL